ncbi:MAG: hypothetical protein ISR65_18650 [Bacteriovoracaceae bacterium]|nr:hypothetical protein [Bacteriovoracaceae bacterium]
MKKIIYIVYTCILFEAIGSNPCFARSKDVSSAHVINRLKVTKKYWDELLSQLYIKGAKDSKLKSIMENTRGLAKQTFKQMQQGNLHIDIGLSNKDRA